MTVLSEPGPSSDAWSPPYVEGDIIADKYRVERLIGSGGMAWVFQATHLLHQGRVALKFLRLDPCADNTAALARFRREARAGASIGGEATARVLDVGTLDDGSPFLVMEWLEGRDLDSVIGERTAVPLATAVDYILQACEGLAETHAAGIIHRDVKPANLFLTRASDGSVRVKLLDFGISKFKVPSSGEHSITSTQTLMGSPVYMSPEQMRSSRRVDARTDIWSMGVILYELLALGRSPFSAPTLPEICTRVQGERPPPLGSVRPDVPRALEALVFRCLEKKPGRRFQTVADLADALAPFGPADARARADRIRRIAGANEADHVTLIGLSRPSPAWRIGVAFAASILIGAMGAAWARPPSAPRAGIAAAPMPYVTHAVPALHIVAVVPPPPDVVAPSLQRVPAGARRKKVHPPHAASEPERVATVQSMPTTLATSPAREPAAALSGGDVPEFGGRE